MVFGIDDLISGGAGILGGALGGIFGNGDAQKAKELQQQALDKINGLNAPNIEDLKLQLEQLRSQGQLTPEMEDTINQQASELENIKSDPRLKDAQMSALQKLQQTGQEGISAQDRMRINDVRRSTEQDAHSRDEAILQNMAARGAAGSGSELAQRLISSQSQADRAGQQGDNIAAQANQQALDAIMKSGQLGGDIRNQDFSQQSQIANAQDVVNRFNAANRQNVSNANTSAKNQAQAANLTAAQRIADSNVGTSNQQQEYNKNLLTNQYNQQVQKAGMQANALNNQAANLNKSAQGTRDIWSGVGEGVGQMATAIGGGAKVVNQPSSQGAVAVDEMKPISGAMYAAHGAMVPNLPGISQIPGDSVKNDKVPAMLSPGEIVVPKSIVHSSDDAVLDFIKMVKKHRG